MGLFSAWRHHLQNAANRQVIADGRQRRSEQAAAAGAEKRRQLEVGRYIQADRERVANQTLEERVEELRGFANRARARGDEQSAAVFADAAEVVHAMTVDEYAEHVQAQLRHDPAAGARALAARKPTT